MSHSQYQSFDPRTVPLQGANLIEASAGTGKTYSVAILVLRLLLEQKIPLREVLMVTFTKAAVAELEERVRLFVRCAHKASLGESIDDTTISELVKGLMEAGRKDIPSLLNEALASLDDLSVLTIHSFCQQTLTEFAFETRQVFAAETLQDLDALITDAVNAYWRSQITTLPVEMLVSLNELGFDRDSIRCVLRDHLAGKRYLDYDADQSYVFQAADHEQWMKEVAELEKAEKELVRCLEQHIEDKREDLRQQCAADRYAKGKLLDSLDDAQKFIAYIKKSRSAGYIVKLFKDTLLPMIAECEDAAEQVERARRNITSRLICAGIRSGDEAIRRYKQLHNLMAFDDMIVNLHEALVKRGSQPLAEGLRKKYRAVFVDEFQDTDRLQYEVFDHAFGDGQTIVFYIGDPKQSIYAWRKADIFTYFEARRSVGANVYSMNHNYRSSEGFIRAMNAFFGVEDVFHFNGETDTIEYIDVDSPATNTRGQLLREGGAEVPITLTRIARKPQLAAAVAAQVMELLDKKTYLIDKNGERQPVRESDIGILVRSNKEGLQVKAELARLNIPAVTIGDAKVLATEETRYLWYLLQAMESPSRATINRALLSPFTGFLSPTILQLNEERSMELFRGYKRIWEEDGVYTALMRFVADYSVKPVLLGGSTEAGERKATNLFQLVELVHKVQVQKALSPVELLGWLKRGMDGMATEGDEYEQRVESDDEAVKIVTIHKSKGLEYKIILAPFLEFKSESKHRTCSFRHPETGEYLAAETRWLSEEQKEWLKKQTEQENRRLLYVALTRGVYKAFLYKCQSTRGRTTLDVFLDGIDARGGQYIDERPALPYPDQSYHKGGVHEPLAGVRTVEGFELQQRNWRRMSYSGLAAKGEPVLRARTGESEEDYDRFLFQQLSRGAQTGNMLHYLFENVNFASDTHWPRVLEEAVQQFSPRQKDLYLPGLERMLKEVLHTPLTVGDETFSLSEVSFFHRIHELEFDFPVNEFAVRSLNHLSRPGRTVRVKDMGEVEGMLNGKIDLFFAHEGKYYILDWKSNYLGDRIEDYTPEKVAEAMNEGNYHLQYLLYTQAVRKYLALRDPAFRYEANFGGVIYLFLRGIRKGQPHGIFTLKPEAEWLEELDGLLEGKRSMPVTGIEVESKSLISDF